MPQTKLKNTQLPDVIQNRTIDTSNDIDTTTTKLTITGGTAGQVLSTDGSGNLSWTTASGGGGGSNDPDILIVKSADETVTNSSTIQDDDHLTTTLNADSYYYGEIDLLLTKVSAASQATFKFAIQGGGLGGFRAFWTPTTPYVMNGTTLTGFYQTNLMFDVNIPEPMRIIFAIKTGGSTQALTFRFTQNTANANGCTVMKGSTMKIWKRATI